MYWFSYGKWFRLMAPLALSLRLNFIICEMVQDSESVDEASVRASERLVSFVKSTMVFTKNRAEKDKRG